MNSYIPSVWSSIGQEMFDRQIDRMFDEALREFGANTETWVPACNVREDENGFDVQVALPGWEPNQVTVEVKDKMLTVRGARSQEGTGTYHVHEIPGGSFCRGFALPASIDHEKARAVHANGLLHISFPKREEAKARRILIEAA
ncbi:MAG TPA: Hsp20/alpha crystallin family protein [Nitrospira sp.]|nr:Hsp20/alpha crystallin family protein [Nitrospira sp.]